ARRHCEAPEVERDHQCFAIDAVEVKIAGVGHATRSRAVDPGARNAFQHRALEGVAHGGNVRGFEVEAGGDPEADRPGDILRARPSIALMMSAKVYRRE